MSQNLALSQAERRVLILRDGRRTREMIEKMLGDAASPTIDVLIAQGYLQSSSQTSTQTASSARTASHHLSNMGKKLGLDRPPSNAASDAPQSSNKVPTTSPSHPQPESRRSLAACKMYMLDMLQLQRSMESSALAVDIQTASHTDQLIDVLIRALRHLCTSTKTSMAERIAERLLETMPEAGLLKLQQATRDLFEKAPTQPVGAQNVVVMRRDVA